MATIHAQYETWRIATTCVERSLAAFPACHCGRITTVVEQAGALRRTCPALAEPAPGHFGRLMALTSAAFHVDGVPRRRAGRSPP